MYQSQRTLGEQTFRIERRDIFGAHVTGSPLTVTFDVVGPPSGTVVPLVNVGRAFVVNSHALPFESLGSLVPAPALAMDPTASHTALAVATDGTLYFGAWNPSGAVVFAIDPGGVVRHVVGGDGLGDPGAATTAAIGAVRALGLDEDGGWLYLGHASSAGDPIVSRVGLRSGSPDAGRIEQIAGGGTADTEPWGDGGDATDATFRQLGDLAVAPDGSVLVFDVGRDHIRRVRLVGETATIETWLDASGGASTRRSGLAIGPDGDVYFDCWIEGRGATCRTAVESPVPEVVVPGEPGFGLGRAVLDGGVVVRDGTAAGTDVSRYDPDRGFEEVWMPSGSESTGDFGDVSAAHTGNLHGVVAWGEHAIVSGNLGPIRLIW